MRIYRTDDLDLYVTDDAAEELLEHYDSLESFIYGPVGLMFWLTEVIFSERKMFREYISLCAKYTGLPDKLAVLAAHGTMTKRGWSFVDGERVSSVQRQIKKLDGLYAAIYLHICNTEARTPWSAKSSLLLPDRDIGFTAEIIHGPAVFSLKSPLRGEIDLYTVDSCCEDLRSRIGQKRSRQHL